ncbi:hypothetical protein [Nesterenkonia sandarakina]|nr:hypothetical protein [Nesterenkonia sandarakina]
MSSQTTDDQTPAAAAKLVLSKGDRRRLEKEERRAREAARAKQVRGLRRFFAQVKADRKATLTRPGATGWNRRGGGPTGHIERPYELQGTTVQLCGYWPFIAGSGAELVGAPLGKDLRRESLVCADPISWFVGELIRNPSAFVLGQPGLGKSSLVKRMVAVLMDWGIIPMALSDARPDYVDLFRACDGQVIEFAPGRSHINPMDVSVFAAALAGVKDEKAREEGLNDLRTQQLSLMSGLVAMFARRSLDPHETTVLAHTIRSMDPDLTDPVLIPDMIAHIRSRPASLRNLTLTHEDTNAYDARVQGLLDALIAMGPDGQYKDLFSKPTTAHIIPGKPVVFDVSAVGENDGVLMAAVQSLCWNLGTITVATEKIVTKDQGLPQKHYLLIMDELWKVLRTSEQMVYFVDSLTRLNRGRGIGQIMITHTMNDLKLPSQAMTDIAWGFVNRSEMVFLGGLAPDEMGNLENVFALSETEKSWLTEWTDDSGRVTGSEKRPHTGKFILKTGKRPGLPFKVHQVHAEIAVTNTNSAWEQGTATTDDESGDLV